MTAFDMEKWSIRISSKPLLAFSGENNTEDVYIIPDTVEDYIYTFDVSNRGYSTIIPLDKTTYEDRDALHAILTAGQIGMPGIIKAQVVGRRTDDATVAVKKSNVFNCVIGESVNAEAQFESLPDSVFEKYVTQVGELAEQVKSNTDATATSESNAKNSEDAAKQSENNAKASEDAAKLSEINAKASENAAKASEEASALSESNAKESETAAATSESNAKESEEKAKASETASAESEENASNSATLAESYAKGGTGTREGEDTDNSRYYSEQSAKSADAALNSQNAAYESEQAASESQKNAAASESNAKASEDASALSEKNAADSQEAASNSEEHVTNIYTALSSWGLSVENGKLCVTYKTEE